MTEALPPIGSPTGKLKDFFGVQKVPLASNFSDLIDVADVGRKAVGLSPDQPLGQGQGMYLDENLKLAVLPQAGGGINVNATGVGITTEVGKGLFVGTNGLAIQPANGINVSTTGVGVTVEASKGLSVGTDGLAVQAGNGINLSPAGVGITVETNKGLAVGINGLAVQADNGINLSPAGVGVAVKANMGLTVDANGLAIKPGSGISLGTAGVGVTANAGRAIIVDSGGVGINYDSTLQIKNNKLAVSDNAFQRRTLSTTLNTSTAIWKQIMRIGASQAYAKVYITSNDGQRFVLTVCCDGNTGYGTQYSLSLSNVYRGSRYGIGSVRIGYDYYGITCVDVQVTETLKSVSLSMNYSASDVQCTQLLQFSDLLYNGGNGNRNIGNIATNANGSIQGG
ncbi:hypothetical protein J3D48_006329 [Pseudomonas fluorescens]|uniref:hypothetical protein n=1 Tax=Pseudomonas fluorescens TaxID=294 RepID=UPI00209EB34C|nr:hypothetical protein [Pseudomonas fluorescens]MCP1489919.1 hypothetical protein [Pseudomonas fluorescens]